MRKLSSISVAVLSAVILTLAACGGGADLSTPTGGVTGAFEAAKSGGLLKQMDFFACIYSGGRVGGIYTGFLSGLSREAIAATGIDYDEFIGAFKASFDDFAATEASRSGDQAVVHVSVKITLDADMSKLREIVKRYAERQGIQMDDATLDAAMSRQVGALPMSEVLEHDVTVVQQNGTWHVCDGTSTAIGTPAVPGAPGSPAVSAAAQPSIEISEGWQVYSDPRAGFRAEFPGLATELSLGATGAQWMSADKLIGYLVVFADARPGAATGVEDFASAVLDGAIADTMRQFNATLDHSSDETADGLPARAFSAHADGRTPETSGLTLQIRGLALVNGYRSYLAMAAAPQLSESDVNRFLRSFRITAPRPTPPVAPTPSPTPAPPLAATAIATGSSYACAIPIGGGVVCWGNNRVGQLGDGTTTNRLQPVMVAGIPDAAAIATSRIRDGGFTCAVRAGGSVLCWGSNRAGQLGDETTTSSLTPVQVSGITDAIAVAVGAEHACALRSGGGVLCWGSNRNGQLGAGGTTESPTPVNVAGIADATALAAGDGHTCALRAGGEVACWGYNLASGTENTTGTTTIVTGVKDAIGVGAGASHTCVVLRTGTILCWGDNGSRQLGDGGTASYSKAPVMASGITDAKALTLGQYYTCALRSDRRISCWGENNSGQLGDGTTTTGLNPVTVFGITDAKAIAAGGMSTCALSSSGQVMCWGAGPLGDGSTTSSTTPVVVRAQ